MAQYCTMCEEYFNDPSRHRYIDCVYYNGCLCGKKVPDRDHIKNCFMLKEKRRKAEQGGTPMLSNLPKSSDWKVCPMCMIRYMGDSNDHRFKICAYYNGCPFCKKRYFEPNHMKACEAASRKKAEVEAKTGDEDADLEGVQYMCHHCHEFIAAAEYDDHKKKCAVLSTAGPASDDDDTKILTTVVVEEPKTYCSLCGSNILSRYFRSHEEHCWKTVCSKFRYTTKSYGEPEVIDTRLEPGEKAVRFEEIP